VDELVLHSSPSDIRAGIERYVEAGVTTPVLCVMSSGADVTRRIGEIGRAVAAS
jgi:hypothetical protein